MMNIIGIHISKVPTVLNPWHMWTFFSAEEIAIIAAAGVAALACLACFLIALLCKRNKRKKVEPEEKPNISGSAPASTAAPSWVKSWDSKMPKTICDGNYLALFVCTMLQIKFVNLWINNILHYLHCKSSEVIYFMICKHVV